MSRTTYIRGPGEMLPIPELKHRLLQQRSALFRQVAESEEELRRLAINVEPERAEEAQEENQSRLLIRLDERGKAEIEAIDRALARIVRGDYGQCSSCGHPIAAARLEAVPAAERCMPCARAH